MRQSFQNKAKPNCLSHVPSLSLSVRVKTKILGRPKLLHTYTLILGVKINILINLNCSKLMINCPFSFWVMQYGCIQQSYSIGQNSGIKSSDEKLSLILRIFLGSKLGTHLFVQLLYLYKKIAKLNESYIDNILSD